MTRKKQSHCLFPGYRWCGPGCSGPGAPINAVDACCRAHDKCLSSGRSRCRCDQEFLSCLRPKTNLYDQEGIIAAIIYIYMKIQADFTCSPYRRNY
ncbi:phospholipase A2 family enzyme [Bacillus sp. J33]|uniref:phospholipase A2 family enzyme n=1 Tax=Bacillus sp. J33 TaxID=935836 RepID=UPI00047C5E60|nr:phospholipase A2 family enzyme [Bacillus sp. J33]